VYTVLLQPYTARVDALQLSAITLAGGCAPLLLAGARDVARTTWPPSPLAYASAAADAGTGAAVLAFFANPWGAVAYSGLLAIVAAYVLFYRGVRILGPTRTAVYSNLQPAVALLVAWATLGELPSTAQALGALAILIGIVLTRK
jgi:drug/metabolite transporter (DMT)-like permease